MAEVYWAWDGEKRDIIVLEVACDLERGDAVDDAAPCFGRNVDDGALVHLAAEAIYARCNAESEVETEKGFPASAVAKAHARLFALKQAFDQRASVEPRAHVAKFDDFRLPP
jgi:hypothetical protein